MRGSSRPLYGSSVRGVKVRKTMAGGSLGRAGGGVERNEA